MTTTLYEITTSEGDDGTMHPAAPVTAAGIPNPDHGAVPATWAP
ncbi:MULTISPECIES: hypothetical protein [Streptomyces]|nr:MULTISPECIES: hypothetical protein [Streptomyces]